MEHDKSWRPSSSQYIYNKFKLTNKINDNSSELNIIKKHLFNNEFSYDKNSILNNNLLEEDNNKIDLPLYEWKAYNRKKRRGGCGFLIRRTQSFNIYDHKLSLNICQRKYHYSNDLILILLFLDNHIFEHKKNIYRILQIFYYQLCFYLMSFQNKLFFQLLRL